MSRVAPSAELREAVVSPSPVETDDRFNTFVAAHFDFVWRLLRRWGLSQADADDAAQQVLVIAARRFRGIEAGNERAFMYGTARRVLLNLRRTFRRRRETGDEALVELPLSQLPPDELVDRGRRMALLDRLLARLPEPLRRVLVLAEIEQLSAPQIAELERIPVGTAASRLRRARASLREELARLGSGAGGSKGE